MTDPLFWLAIALLVAGIPASFLPVVPGSALTVAGLLVHWFGVGTVPTPIMIGLLVLVFVVFVLDFLAGVLAARAGGASWATAGAGLVVGLVLSIVLTPIGLVVGLAGTVFVVELVNGRSVEDSGRAAVYTTVATLASNVVEALVSVGVLVVVLLAGGL